MNFRSLLPVTGVLTIAAVAMILATPKAGAHFSNKIDSVLAERLARTGTADVIVQLQARADLTGAEQITDRTARIRFVYERLRDVADRTQPSLAAFLKEKNASYQAFYITNAMVVNNANAQLLNELAARPEVARLKLNVQSHLRLPQRTAGEKIQQVLGNVPRNLTALGVDRVWDELHVRGKGIVIAGQDTGYNWRHEAIHRQYRGVTINEKGEESVNHDYNWHDSIHQSNQSACPANGTEPCDDHEHGTHTMGSMVGDDGLDNHIGVAPEAKWMGCRNMDSNVGTVASYTECFEFFLAPYPVGGDPRKQGRPEMAPHIINNSWGCPTEEGCQGNEFIEVVRAVRAAGIVIVVALGNEGPDCATAGSPPGSYIGEVVTAGAYDQSRLDIAFFSSRGPSPFNDGVGPDVVASGVNVRSSVSQGTGADQNTRYEWMSGTSMASPHTAGVIALLWSAHPELIGQVQKTVELLHSTATPRTTEQSCGKYAGSSVPNSVFGYGVLDAYKLISTAKGLYNKASQ
jgi:subtilisin family serine protease